MRRIARLHNKAAVVQDNCSFFCNCRTLQTIENSTQVIKILPVHALFNKKHNQNDWN